MRESSSRRSARALVAEGERSFDVGDFARAIQRADEALHQNPEFLPALSLKAAAQDALGDAVAASAAHEEALRLAPDDLETIIEAAEFYLSHGREDGDESALDRARKLARSGMDRANETGDELAADLAMLEADALVELGSPRQALERLEAALRLRPGDDRLRIERGLVLYELCRFEDARRQVEEVLRREPTNAAAVHTLGLLEERAGRKPEASARFEQACALAPEDYPAPIHVSQQEFDRSVEDALEELPQQIRDYLSNVAITVEDIPDECDLVASDPPLSPSILGIFRGSPIGEKASMDPWTQFPSSIVLFQKNLERFATTRRDLVEQIRVTLLHEVGHFLGLDEEQLRQQGLD